MMDMDDTYFRFTSSQDQALVTEIQKYPVLYYPKHADYKNGNVKEEIWKKVSDRVGRNVDDCRNRWRNIKDTYFRVKKKRDSRDAAVPYRPKKWDKKLSFLDKCYKPYRFSREVYYEQTSTSSEATGNCVEDEILDSMETANSEGPCESSWFSNRFTYEEDNLLVAQVAKRPALYRNRHPDNKVPLAKDKMWKEIAAIVGRSDTEVKKRFRNIRDGYLKKLKTKSKNQAEKLVNCRRNRLLYEKLSFLNPTLNRANPIQGDDSNKMNEEETGDEEMSGDSDSQEKTEARWNNSVIFVDTMDDSLQDAELRSDSPEEEEVEVITVVKDESQTPSTHHRLSGRLAEKKKKKELVASLLEELQKKMSKEEDDVDLFLKSVGIALKKLPKPLVAEAKIKILRMVSELETKAAQN